MIRPLLACLALTGCVPRAPLHPLPPGAATISELTAARTELLHAAEGPLAGEAAFAWSEAEEALSAAEAVATHPGAQDRAYVALRLAQRARVATLYQAEREALERARATVRRLGDDEERRAAFFAGLDRDRRAEAEAARRTRAAHLAALDEALAGGGEILDRPDGVLVRLSAEEIFLPGTSLFRSGAEPRLSQLAAALRGPPACPLRLALLDDVEGTRTEPAQLAARRRLRVREALCAAGVPQEAFVTPPRHPPPGTQVDLLWMERQPAGAPP